MNGRGCQRRAVWIAAVWLAVHVGALTAAELPSTATPPETKQRSEPREVELRGRVVCLVEERAALHAARAPACHEHLWAFKTDDRKLYKLVRTRYSEALFVDPRLRTKELLLKGRLDAAAQTFDVSRMRSVRDGVVCDLYYYCSVCSIKTIAPGPCMCCQQPVDLVEKPRH